MDSLIHYEAQDMASMVAKLAARADRGVVFTFAPRTALLTLMGWVGKLLPRGDRSPELEPIREATLRRLLGAHPGLTDFTAGAQRVFDALKDKPGRKVIFIIWAGANNPFKIIDLKPFGTRMPSFNEMDNVKAMRRAGFQCRVQSVDRKDPVDPKHAAMVRKLRAEYQRARKLVPDYDAQCTTSVRDFFPVFSPTGEDLQLLGGHISPRGSKLQFENPVLLITHSALYFSARLDKSRTRGGETTE
jgi:hypothetical protein